MEPLHRLAPWPSGVLGDFGAAVDQVLQAEVEESQVATGSEVWRRRRHMKTLGQRALKLKQQVAKRFVELDTERFEISKNWAELDALVPVACQVSASQLGVLSDPMLWDAQNALLQDVGSFRAGWFLLGGEALGGKLGHLRGKHEAALLRLDEMSRWYIPVVQAAEFQCSLAVGIPILDATCHQLRLLEAWVARQELRRESEHWCSRSFAMAMLAVSTSKAKQRQRESMVDQLLPAHEDPKPRWKAWKPKTQEIESLEQKPPTKPGGSKAQNVAFWLAKPKVPPPPPGIIPPPMPSPPQVLPPPPPPLWEQQGHSKSDVKIFLCRINMVRLWKRSRSFHPQSTFVQGRSCLTLGHFLEHPLSITEMELSRVAVRHDDQTSHWLRSATCKGRLTLFDLYNPNVSIYWVNSPNVVNAGVSANSHKKERCWLVENQWKSLTIINIYTWRMLKIHFERSSPASLF